jgi:hypothetical protein
MSNAAEYFSNTPGAEIEQPELLEGHVYEPDLGYYVEEQALGYLSIVGFSVPYPERPKYFPAAVRPRTGYNTLPTDNGSNERMYGKINRGVGPRVHNTVEALRGPKADIREAGIYSFDIAHSDLLDMRTMTDATVLTLAEQAGKLATYALAGGNRLTDLVHRAYGRNAKAVLFGQSPNGLRKQRRRRAEKPDGIEPEMIIIRSSNTLMHRVGTYKRPK